MVGLTDAVKQGVTVEERYASIDFGDVLKGIVEGAARTTDEARRELANDALTLEFLKAGVRLFQKGSFDPTSLIRGVVSQRAVVKEVAEGEWKQGATLGALRDRWPRHSDYVRDLVSFVFAAREAIQPPRVDPITALPRILADAFPGVPVRAGIPSEHFGRVIAAATRGKPSTEVIDGFCSLVITCAPMLLDFDGDGLSFAEKMRQYPKIMELALKSKQLNPQ